MSHPAFPEARELAEVSARIGADPLLVQGPGGNSSFKSGDALWVKASGVWLAEALERPIFSGLSLFHVRAIAATGETEDFSSARLAESDPALRPSIETMLHALMPQSAVLHAHAVGSMTVSILADGKERAATALAGLNWGWVPYRRPGAPLAAAVSEAIGDAAPDILILQNHGVVTAGDTPLPAETLLREVERRLTWPLRYLPVATMTDITAGERYEPLPALAGLALDPELFAILTAAALFPDQVVFMGGAVPGAAPDESIDTAADRAQHLSGVAPALILQPGVGAFVAKNRTPAAAAVIQGLFDVARRLPAGAQVVGLPGEAVAALLGWEAEAYRIKLASEGAQ